MIFKVRYSLIKDTDLIINSVFHFNYFKHGRVNIEKKLLSIMDTGIQKIIKNNQGEKEIKSKLKIYLAANKKERLGKVKVLQEELNTIGGQIVSNLEFLYQKSFPFSKITLYLSSSPLCPYSYKAKNLFIFYKAMKNIQLRIIEHELNHFMFYYYYADFKKHIGKEKYELLKESLTFFSNPEEKGKPNEKELRELYASRSWSNLEKAIKAGFKLQLK